MAKHSLTEVRPQTDTGSRGAAERTTVRTTGRTGGRAVAPISRPTTGRVRRGPRAGRVALQVIGLAAASACVFVTVVAPNLDAEPASASFEGTFAQGAVASQTLDISGSAAASVFRDSYSVTEAPKPVVVVETKTPSSSSGSGSGSSSSDDGCPNPDAAVADPSGAKAVAADLAAARGWTGAQFDALIALWSRESGWRVNALNPSSCAYGIPQALPGSKMASAGSDWLTNPATQITWGLNYIQGRYGDPQSALAHSDANHWY